MTTFATQYGKYRWLRLPLDLSVSSESFQKRLHGALTGLKGTLCVADDIIVHVEDVKTHIIEIFGLQYVVCIGNTTSNHLLPRYSISWGIRLLDIDIKLLSFILYNN